MSRIFLCLSSSSDEKQKVEKKKKKRSDSPQKAKAGRHRSPSSSSVHRYSQVIITINIRFLDSCPDWTVVEFDEWNGYLPHLFSAVCLKIWIYF